MNYKFLILLLIFFIIIIIDNMHTINVVLSYLDYYRYRDDNFIKLIDQNKFYDEKNELIDHKNSEIIEQYIAYKFIEPDDIVLELGARYGTVSVIINKIVKNKKEQVVVEPDINIIPSLDKNRLINKCDFTILPKFISNKNKKIIDDGYGTRMIDTNEETNSNNKLSYNEFKKLYPQKFNTLIADCEGCLEEFLDMMGDDFYKLKKVLFEADLPKLTNYDKIKKKLFDAGFKEKFNSFNFIYVFIKE